MSDETEVQKQLKQLQEEFDKFDLLFNDLRGTSSQLTSQIKLQLDDKVKDLIFRLKAVLIRIDNMRDEYLVEKDRLVECINLSLDKDVKDCFKNLSKLLVIKEVVQILIVELHINIYNFSLLLLSVIDKHGQLYDKSIYNRLLNYIKLIESKLQEFEVALSNALNS